MMQALAIALRWLAAGALALVGQRRPRRRRSTTRAPPTPRSRSARPCPTAARRRPTARSARRIGAYFKMINEQGGINGRKINFIILDDGYSPPKTVEMVRKLVEQDEVLLVFQTLGTPSQHGDPQVHEREEGAAAVRRHRRDQVGRPEELPVDDGLAARTTRPKAKIYAKYILKNKPNAKIGVLYQNDDYGKDYLKGLKDGLGEKARR